MRSEDNNRKAGKNIIHILKDSNSEGGQQGDLHEVTTITYIMKGGKDGNTSVRTSA
jgi:hypothetical protein